MDIETDSDWAGDPRTRQSTSAGCIMWGGCVKDWSKQQKVVARSSAEAEFYAMVKGT